MLIRAMMRLPVTLLSERRCGRDGAEATVAAQASNIQYCARLHLEGEHRANMISGRFQ